MLAVRDGDIGKLGVLFERHHVRLYNYLLRMTSSTRDSEDLVQEVFFRMLKYRNTYRGDSKFTFWMYQIARNTCFDHFRKWRRETQFDDKADDLVSQDPIPVEDLEQKQEAALVRTALTRLPVDKREVLVLSRYQGMKYEEIAEILDCKVGTVKARVHRAIKELRDIFFELSSENAS